ncbi:bifunctional alpha/beta hydrolase/OsmC family protein [Pseudooceanicola sp. CBS1P-1]|uniref:Alpha/beta fold hydrolase n=1 Tax=Pseudooceanicola albus TaxID=2692189 RepID=A0A6L7GCI9_9RHOB|nr:MULTISPECIES: bifunctional alpha/beta hydrolase/OsmC family protein [Pseudooceanicola]MBT9386868.1 bifunctional alpha/beta hydrolase/OsmC family protein [Pseudooceanicola endophyticus]MXN20996.1 alpha/beta fold hydrolase [Pseudooceanicola albus]
MGDTNFNFTGSNGNTLSGRLESPRANPRGWAIFAHCFTCGKDSLAASRISRALARDGIGVLRFDFAGLGRSEGDFGSSGFACNVADLLAAARAMEEAGMAPALLVGHSLGGAAVLAAASSIPSVKAVATLGAPADVAHILHQFDADALDEITRTGRASVRLSGRDFEFDRTFVEDVRQHDLSERIRTLRKPLLIMHAPGDDVVGIDNATQIFTAARHPKSFVSLDDADHLLTARKDADYAAGVIASWAARYLPEVEPDTAALSEAPQDGILHAEETGKGGYQVAIATRGHGVTADEPVSLGGLDSGMSPVELVSAALGACTVMTLRMYADRKSYPLEGVAVDLTHERQPEEDRPHRFSRAIALKGALSEEQRRALINIADRCPVGRILEHGARIETRAAGPEGRDDD